MEVVVMIQQLDHLEMNHQKDDRIKKEMTTFGLIGRGPIRH